MADMKPMDVPVEVKVKISLDVSPALETMLQEAGWRAPGKHATDVPVAEHLRLLEDQRNRLNAEWLERVQRDERARREQREEEMSQTWRDRLARAVSVARQQTRRVVAEEIAQEFEKQATVTWEVGKNPFAEMARKHKTADATRPLKRCAICGCPLRLHGIVCNEGDFPEPPPRCPICQHYMAQHTDAGCTHRNGVSKNKCDCQATHGK